MSDYQPAIDALERELLLMEQKKGLVKKLQEVGSLESLVESLSATKDGYLKMIADEEAQLAAVIQSINIAKDKHTDAINAMQQEHEDWLASFDAEKKEAEAKAKAESEAKAAEAEASLVEQLKDAQKQLAEVLSHVGEVQDQISQLEELRDIAQMQKDEAEAALKAVQEQIHALAAKS
jgi:chromosome segregation ATPase